MRSWVSSAWGRARPVARRTLRDSWYLLLVFPFASASFVVLVTGLSMALGTVSIVIGVPIGAATLYAGRAFAQLERRRLRAVGTVVDDPPVDDRWGPWSGASTARPGSGGWRRWVRPLADAGLWRETAHGIVAMPVAIVTWSLMLGWWTTAAGGLTAWVWEPVVHRYGVDLSVGTSGMTEPLGWPVPGLVLDVVAGVVAVVTLPWLTAGCVAVHAGLARWLLTPSRTSLQRRVAELSHARDQLGEAETDGLRRLERDLHDGPQQSLIRIGMDLAAAERRLAEGDADATAALLADLRRLNSTVVADLRALSRSIAPPVLSERGLAAALTAAAATSPIPVSVHYGLAAEPPKAVSTAVYFVACEAMANAVKYSQASRIEVRVDREAGDLVVQVRDDGTGGAVLVPGHGLAGLRDRVTALDGRLVVADAPGTTVTATLPVRESL